MTTTVHGDKTTYKNGCRCDPCTEANRAYIRDYRRQYGAKPRPLKPPRTKAVPVRTPTPSTAWQADAACKGKRLDLFFPTHGDSPPAGIVELCSRCPVRVECLEFALSLGPETAGVWAGTSQRERDRIRARREGRRSKR